MLETQRCHREDCNRILAAPAFATFGDLQANTRGYCSADCEMHDNNKGRNDA